ncbi:MAG: glycosyltransferase family 4 protein [Thermoplasmata archaeon]
MEIAILTRSRYALSVSNYRANLTRELSKLGVEFIPFPEEGSIPDAELVWEPSLGMRPISKTLRRATVPVVATVQGIRAFSLPFSLWSDDIIGRLRLIRSKIRMMRDWHWFSKKVSAIITPSTYGAEEVRRAFAPTAAIHCIPHGVDLSTFHPSDAGSYFLMVIASPSLSAVKNLRRVLKAYEGMEAPLKVIMPGGVRIGQPGVETITETLDGQHMASLYRGASALVFPSLRESFGMPILEAMASGCPVITSNTTACAEVAGDAALLVDPESIDAIRQAMLLLTQDDDLYQALREKGIKRANEFTWDRSARGHLEVFREVLEQPQL